MGGITRMRPTPDRFGTGWGSGRVGLYNSRLQATWLPFVVMPAGGACRPHGMLCAFAGAMIHCLLAFIRNLPFHCSINSSMLVDNEQVCFASVLVYWAP